MSILNNAIDSIKMGLEDYKSSDPKRLISCTRNLFAGILLLFKHKLSQLSPANSDEALLKQRILPERDENGNVVWRGSGRKTVDVQQIKERLRSLNINVDWDRVDAINEFRNDIEHYHSTQSRDAARGLISNSFIVVRDFIAEHLGQDPKALLGDDAWNTLISVSEVYEREKAECVGTIENVPWNSEGLESALVEFKCSSCGSGLIKIENPHEDKEQNEFSCKSCGRTWQFEAIAEEAIESYFAGENYMAVTDGGDMATIPCPSCNKNTYIFEEKYCPLCGEEAEHTCKRCSSDIIPEELDGSGYCSYCSYISRKDD